MKLNPVVVVASGTAALAIGVGVLWWKNRNDLPQEPEYVSVEVCLQVRCQTNYMKKGVKGLVAHEKIVQASNEKIRLTVEELSKLKAIVESGE